MRLRVTSQKGVRYGGTFYTKGQEFELVGRQVRVQAAALSRVAERADPVIVGNPPPLPRPRGRPPGSRNRPREEELAVEGTPTEPVEEDVAPPASTPDEPSPEQPQAEQQQEATLGPDGTYQRRDLRPEE